VINRIQLLRNIGQFDSVDSGENLPLNRFVLIYAENGREKTTVAAILRSLASGDPIPIVERRLASQHPPHVVLDCSGGQTSIVFQDGRWSNALPDIAIFDDHFVDDNVCCGLTVESGHRQNLHELVLGSHGVSLNRQLRGWTDQIETHISELRTRAAAIPSSVRGPFSVDDFCELPSRTSIEDEIRLVEQCLAAAREADAIRLMSLFDLLDLPAFDVEALSQTLALDLPALGSATAARVQAQITRLGPEGEAWVADGMHRLIHADGDHQECPFCAQDLDGSTIIRQYETYFGEEYAQLRRNISDAIVIVDRLHNPGVSAAFERNIRLATDRRQFWS
jgi:wobble nucleotide-excising tRNase